MALQRNFYRIFCLEILQLLRYHSTCTVHPYQGSGYEHGDNSTTTENLLRGKFNVVSRTEAYLNSTYTPLQKSVFLVEQTKVIVKWSRPNRVKLNGALSLSCSIPKLYFLVPNHAVYHANHVVGHTLNDRVLWQIRVVCLLAPRVEVS